MKTLLGILLIIIGVALGLYVGGYLLFIGGIVNIFTGIMAIVGGAVGNAVATQIAIGVGKVVLASIVGWIIFIIFLVTGCSMLD